MMGMSLVISFTSLSGSVLPVSLEAVPVKPFTGRVVRGRGLMGTGHTWESRTLPVHRYGVWSTTALAWVQIVADTRVWTSGSTGVALGCCCGSGSSLEGCSTCLHASLVLVAHGLSDLVVLIPRGYACLRRSDSAGQAPPPREVGWSRFMGGCRVVIGRRLAVRHGYRAELCQLPLAGWSVPSGEESLDRSLIIGDCLSLGRCRSWDGKTGSKTPRKTI